MRRIENRIADVCLSAREADVLVCFGMFVMGLAFGQVAVIVILVDDHDRRRAVNHRPTFLAGFVDHPVVPACATDGEGGDFVESGKWKEKEVASCGTVKLVLFPDAFSQPDLPPIGEKDRLCNIIIPTLAEKDEFRPLTFDLFRRFDEIVHEDHVRVDDAEEVALRVFTGKSKHGGDQRRARIIPRHVGDTPHAKFFCRFGKTRLFTEQDNLDIGKQSP